MKSALLARLSGFLLFLHHCCAAAAQAPDNVPSPVAAAPVSLTGMLQVLLGLAVVLAMVAGAAWLMRRFAPGQSGAGGAIRIVGGVMVGPREKVVLVEIGETWLVLGVASGQVNALHTLPRPAGGFAATAPASTAFSDWLKRAAHLGKDG